MCPTPNDFSNFQFTPQQDDYKQSSTEQRDRSILNKDNEPLLPGPSQGNYPRTFDSGMPSENYNCAPGNYPCDYDSTKVPGTNPGSGEFGQTVDAGGFGPYPGTDMVPSPTPSKQFSSKMSGDPKELLAEADTGVKLHSDLLRSYGYGMPTATLGTHPWLRDSLTTEDEQEPGNAAPRIDLKMPFERGK
jgi:hypothetical protein